MKQKGKTRMPVKGLIFDAYGTLYDVHSVHAKTEELCPGKGATG